jgi:hypothetical protein
MANLMIEMPDDLACSLERIAAAQHKSIQELAIERIRSLVEANPENSGGSAGAVLQAMLDPPHPSASDVDDFDSAIKAGRLPISPRDLLSDSRHEHDQCTDEGRSPNGIMAFFGSTRRSVGNLHNLPWRDPVRVGEAGRGTTPRRPRSESSEAVELVAV